METTKIRKKTTLAISTLLFLTMISTVMAQTTTLSVYPASVTKQINQNFTIDIRVDDVDDLWTFQINIQWNSAKIECTDNEVHAPWSNWRCWFNETDNTAGTYFLVVNAEDPAVPFSTTTPVSLVTLTYRTKAAGSTPIEFIYETVLGDYPYADPIPHSTADGSVTILTPSVGDEGISEPVSEHELMAPYFRIAVSATLISIAVVPTVIIGCRIYNNRRKKER